jgi:hypothetical protein
MLDNPGNFQPQQAEAATLEWKKQPFWKTKRPSVTTTVVFSMGVATVDILIIKKQRRYCYSVWSLSHAETHTRTHVVHLPVGEETSAVVSATAE